MRKAVFQIHLWTGIGIGIYVLLISVSGSAIVFRRELASVRRPIVAAVKGPRLSPDQVAERAQQLYPAYEIFSVRESNAQDRPDEIVLGGGKSRMSRLFDPYTGADLGDPRPAVNRALEWLSDLHFNLLSGLTGRIANGVGAVFFTLLSLTGAFLWWPGAGQWRRSITVNWKTKFARWNWDLHSAIGFWSFLFVLVWGISGVCLCFPGVFDRFVSPPVLVWLNRLHFGRFNRTTEAIWTVLGLAPAALFVTGALMWWNRVLSKSVVRRDLTRAARGLMRTP